MKQKIFIVTTTESSNKFLENFSCWCAGALEAKGHSTHLAIIPIELFAEPLSRKFLQAQASELKSIQNNLLTTQRLVLIFPEINNMIPNSLASFIELLATKKGRKTCQLVTIILESTTYHENHALFNYPLHKLDTLFGFALSSKRIQFNNSPSGNMCPLFAESYNELISLIQQILD